MGEYRGDAKVLAGGQSLIPLMKLRILSPAHIVDLNGIKGLEHISREKGVIAIGAMTRTADIALSRLLKEECAILPDCASHIADPLVRNLGTIGGNISHADPTNDMPAVMVACGAEMIVAGPKGRRKVAASDFFRDTFVTAMEDNEILTELRIPVGKHRAGAYCKLERQAGDFGVVGVAASLSLSADGRCKECGIALTSVGPAVIRAARSEKLVIGSRVDAGTVAEAAKLAAEDSRPASDLRGSEGYKREMVKVMTRRALLLALKRARSMSR